MSLRRGHMAWAGKMHLRGLTLVELLVVMVIIGVMVGSMVVGMYLPIFKLAAAVGG